MKFNLSLLRGFLRLGNRYASDNNGSAFTLQSNVYADSSIDLEVVMRQPEVNTCVRILAETIAQLPLKVCKENEAGGVDVDKTHNLNSLIRKPNTFQTSYDFKTSLVMQLLIYGNYVAYLNKAKSGRVIQILPQNPNETSYALNSRWMPEYRLSFDSTKIYGARDVLHVKDLASDGVAGDSRLEQVFELLELARSMDVFAKNVFDSGVNINGILMFPNIETGETLAKIKKQWYDNYIGVNKAGGTAFLSGGGSFTEIKASNQSADTINFGDNLSKRIAAVFGVPLHRLQRIENKFSNVAQANTGFYRDTISPLLVRIEESLDASLLSESDIMGGYSLKFDAEQLLKGDVTAQTNNTVARVSSGIITANEARIYLGYAISEEEGADVLNAAASTDAIADPMFDRSTEPESNAAR